MSIGGLRQSFSTFWPLEDLRAAGIFRFSPTKFALVINKQYADLKILAELARAAFAWHVQQRRTLSLEAVVPQRLLGKHAAE